MRAKSIVSFVSLMLAPSPMTSGLPPDSRAAVTPVLSAFPLVRAGKLRPLIVFTDEPDNTYPGVPLSKDSKWDIACFPLIGTYVAPPHLPVDQAKILEEAFAKAVREPGFLDWTKKVNLEVTPMNGAKVRAITSQAYKNADKYMAYFEKQ